MQVNPAKVCLYKPPGLSAFKVELFDRVGRKLGRMETDQQKLAELPDDMVPIVGCTPALRPMIDDWLKRERRWIYWDRGYARRIFATWLPRGEYGGYYRWHISAFQLSKVRTDLPSDRWNMLQTEVKPWRLPTDTGHIVIARPSSTYLAFHNVKGKDPRNGMEITWLDETVYRLSLLTKRQLVVRDKETKRPLADDIKDAHCLVTHGSNTAVEAVIMGCPVFVHESSAAIHVGKSATTQLDEIERPATPDRTAWLNSLAYSQFNEQELVDGTLWQLLQ